MPQSNAPSEEKSPGLDRVLAILSSFQGENLPEKPAVLARKLGIPRSSAYQIVRTLVLRGYLERVNAGHIRLGPRFGELLIAHGQQHRSLPFDPDWHGRRQGAATDPISQVPRSFLWNPKLTEMVSCARLRRTPPYRIGFSNASTHNPWRMAMLHGMLHYAKKNSSRIERFIVSDAEDDPARQSADIQTLLQKRLDLLLVSCNQGKLIDEALAQAAAAHLPVVVVDRHPANMDHFVTSISASDIALGRITAQWLIEKIQGKGKIFMLAGVKGASPAERRIAAATEVFSQYPQIDIVDIRYTDWHEEKGRMASMDLAQIHGMPAGVWCDSGLEGAGSLRAFLDIGVAPAQIPPHTGGDVNHAFQLAVRHDIPLAAVEYPAWMGARAVQAALDVLAGKTMPRHIEVHSRVVVSRGSETHSVHADIFAEDYVRWDKPHDYVASHGLEDDYHPVQCDMLKRYGAEFLQ